MYKGFVILLAMLMVVCIALVQPISAFDGMAHEDGAFQSIPPTQPSRSADYLPSEPDDTGRSVPDELQPGSSIPTELQPRIVDELQPRIPDELQTLLSDGSYILSMSGGKITKIEYSAVSPEMIPGTTVIYDQNDGQALNREGTRKILEAIAVVIGIVCIFL